MKQDPSIFDHYNLDRYLDEQEINEQLSIVKNYSNSPEYSGSIIKFNSTYIDSIDINYHRRGLLSIGSFVGLLLSFLCFYWAIKQFIFDLLNNFNNIDFGSILIDSGFGLALFLFFFFVFLKREAFTYTHFPIRLNRKTRMVHVFRRNGTVLSIPWDEIFFTIGRGMGYGEFQNTYIAAHVLNKKKIVKETFALGGFITGGTEHTLNLWEFYRRYMEEGPENLIPHLSCPLNVFPLDRGPETFRMGWEAVKIDAIGPVVIQLIFLPFTFCQACARWLAMRTCRIPVWPKDIEDACAIEPNDSWVRDVTTNDEDMKFGY